MDEMLIADCAPQTSEPTNEAQSGPPDMTRWAQSVASLQRGGERYGGGGEGHRKATRRTFGGSPSAKTSKPGSLRNCLSSLSGFLKVVGQAGRGLDGGR